MYYVRLYVRRQDQKSYWAYEKQEYIHAAVVALPNKAGGSKAAAGQTLAVASSDQGLSLSLSLTLSHTLSLLQHGWRMKAGKKF